jgi:hypothetical protein
MVFVNQRMRKIIISYCKVLQHFLIVYRLVET